MTDFKQLIKLLQDAVDNFQKVVPDIQRGMLDRLREELSGLKIKNGTIQVGAENVRKIAAIKAKLQEIILTPEYKAAVKDYLKTFDQAVKLQNSYFKGLEKKFTPPALGDMLKKQAVLGVLQNLTERGIETNVLSGIEDILRKNITTGGSYAELQRALENNLVDNDTGDGSLTRYTKQITTDALNQHAAQYTQLVSSDLGYEWFKYAGSNIETTRPFCLACVEKQWLHVSEFPALLKGDFPEFGKFDGKLYKGQPAGMIPDTTPSNFQINRGGYNCGHQLRPVPEEMVPKAVRDQLGKPPKREAEPAPPMPKPKKEKPASEPASGLPAHQQVIVDKIRQQNRAAVEEMEGRGYILYDDIMAQLDEDVTIIFDPAEGSAFKYLENKMVIGEQNRPDASEFYLKKIFAHEGGHAMHFNKRIITQDTVHPDFATFFKKLQDIIKGNEAKINDLLYDEAYKDLQDFTRLEQISLLHDTLGSLTRGEYGQGHSVSYYRTGNYSEMEVFAHSLTLAKLDNIFADLTPEVRAMVDAMKEYGLNVLK